MKEFVIKNSSEMTLRVMFEPWAYTYDLGPGQTATITDPTPMAVLQIDFHDENFLSLWVSDRAKIKSGGKELREAND